MAAPAPGIEFDFGDLPADLQRRLQAIAERDDEPLRLDRARWPLPIASMLLGGAILLWLGSFAVQRAGLVDVDSWVDCVPWSAADRLRATGLGALAFSLLLPGLAAERSRRTAPLGTFWCVDSGYLVDARDRIVRLYPLAELDADPNPPARTLRLRFHSSFVDIDLRERGGADFATVLLRRIDRAVAEHEQRRAGYRGEVRRAAAAPDFFARARRSGTSRALLRGLGAVTLCAGVGAAFGGIFLSAIRSSLSELVTFSWCTNHNELGTGACAAYVTRFPGARRLGAADDAFFRIASRSLPDLDTYAAALPQGHHSGEIPAVRAAIFREAAAARETVKPTGKRGQRAFNGLIESLAAADTGTASIRFTHTVERRALTTADYKRLDARAAAPPATTDLDDDDDDDTARKPASESILEMAEKLRGKDPVEVLYPEEKMDPPSSAAFPDDGAVEQEDAFSAALGKTLARALPALGLTLRRAGPGAPALLEVGYLVEQRRSLLTPQTETGRGPRLSFWELTFHFTILVESPGHAPERLKIDTYPPLDLTCVRQQDIYGSQRSAAFRLLGERLSALLGAPIQASSACPKAEEKPPGEPDQALP